jgi:hypothetical protein
MLPEALVIFACLNSTGCGPTSSHYYNTNPAVREVVERHEKNIEKFLGPTVVTTVGPFLYAAAGGTGTIHLNKYFNLQLSKQVGILIFSKEF